MQLKGSLAQKSFLPTQSILDEAVEGASRHSGCPATVALRLVPRQPETHPSGSNPSGCLMLHFAKSHDVSAIFAQGMPGSTAAGREGYFGWRKNSNIQLSDQMSLP
jgi:hypothetical protein